MNKKTFTTSCAGIVALSSALLLSACFEEEASSASASVSADEVSCTAKELKDSSGYELSCGGKVVGTIKHGEDGIDGIDGADGTNGVDGKDGVDGIDGVEGKKGKDGTSCTAEELNDRSGYNIVCGGEVVGTLYHGKNGSDGKDGEDGKDGVTTSSASAASSASAKSSASTTPATSSAAVTSSATATSSASVKSSSSITPARSSTSIIADGDYGLGECTFAREGVVAKYTQNDKYYVCRVGSWELATTVEFETYGHSCTLDNINEVIKGNVRKVTDYKCTLNGWQNTDGTADLEHAATGNLWSGKDHSYSANFQDNYNHSWYVVSSTRSEISWPANASYNETDYACAGGACGTAWKKGNIIAPFTLTQYITDEHYVGAGFNVAEWHYTNSDGEYYAKNISSRDGLCLVYEATVGNPVIEIGSSSFFGSSVTATFYAQLEVTTGPTLIDIPWSKFIQQESQTDVVSMDDVLHSAGFIQFKVKSKDDVSGIFGIYAIGWKGSCSILF